MSSLIGIAGIVYGLYFVFTYPKGGFSGYFDLPSLVLLGVLPPSIMLLSNKITDVHWRQSADKKTFFAELFEFLDSMNDIFIIY